jgi:four helix bundle protein
MLERTFSPFQNKLKKLMDEYVHCIYKLTKKYPREELYGATSQHRRSAMSVVLNYIEGYSRRRKKVQLNFYETSYGSLGESRYLCHFALKEGWITTEEYKQTYQLGDEIGAMLWSEISATESDIGQGKE